MVNANPRGRPVDHSKDEAIMTAARSLLFNKGPQAVTMEAVAIHAGVSKATLYTRHPSREALIFAVVQQQVHELSAGLLTIPQSLEEARVLLTGFVLRLTAFLSSKEHVALMHAMGFGQLENGLAWAELYQDGPQRMHESLSDWLDTVSRNGILRCLDPSRSAEVLLGMLMGLDLLRVMYSVPVDPSPSECAGHADFIVETFFRLHTGEVERASTR